MCNNYICYLLFFSSKDEFKFDNMAVMDQLVSEHIQANFVEYALIQLTIGSTPNSMSAVLPKLINMVDEHKVNYMEYYVQCNYRDFRFMEIDNFDPQLHNDISKVDNNYYNLDQREQQEDQIFVSTVTNKNECGIGQGKVGEEQRIVYFYYAYNPFNIESHIEINLAETIKNLLIGFETRKTTARNVSAKVSELEISDNRRFHCWNFLIRTNAVGGGPDFFSCEDKDDYEPQFVDGRMEIKVNNYCLVAQFHYGPAMAVASLKRLTAQNYSHMFEAVRGLSFRPLMFSQLKGVVVGNYVAKHVSKTARLEPSFFLLISSSSFIYFLFLSIFVII
jgi:hypothetical protein